MEPGGVSASTELSTAKDVSSVGSPSVPGAEIARSRSPVSSTPADAPWGAVPATLSSVGTSWPSWVRAATVAFVCEELICRLDSSWTSSRVWSGSKAASRGRTVVVPESQPVMTCTAVAG